MWLVMYTQMVLENMSPGVEDSRRPTDVLSSITECSCDAWSAAQAEETETGTHEEQEVEHARLDDDPHRLLDARLLRVLRQEQELPHRAAVLPAGASARESATAHRTHQVLYQIMSVATPVVTSVTQYEASCALRHSGGLSKLPPSMGAPAAMLYAAQYEITPDVAGRCRQPRVCAQERRAYRRTPRGAAGERP